MIDSIGDLLAVDPGLEHPAAAFFRGGVLIAAERIKQAPGMIELERLERAVRVAASISRWAGSKGARPRAFVCEHPQVYTQSKSKGDPNDLLPLCSIGGALASVLAYEAALRNVGLIILSPTPSEWTGQVPKVTTGNPWESPRGVRVKSRLTKAEFLAVQANHDSIDAVGLGLHALGRFDRVRIFPGAVPE